MKSGFTLDNIPNLISSSATDKTGWSLCIGAGASLPLFPDWYELSAELANEFCTGKKMSRDDMIKLEFSPEALIQMVRNTASASDRDFFIKMSEILYKNLRSRIEPSDWDAIADVFEATRLTSCTASRWRVFKKYREELFSKTTSYSLAKVVLKSIDKNIAPKSILSFNAEPLFFALLNSFLIEYKSDETHPIPKQVFDRVVSSLSSQGYDRIPYIFCHGLLPAREDDNVFSCSIDKLVFLEEEYLQLANTSFSWQANAFLNTCMSQHVIFFGTSLTDQNMRRWLSWIQSNRLSEIRQHDPNAESSTQHYWIRVLPEDPEQIPWIEAAVAHLGIRLIWLKSWSEAPIALEKLLGLYEPPKKKPPSTKGKRPFSKPRKIPRKKPSVAKRS